MVAHVFKFTDALRRVVGGVTIIGRCISSRELGTHQTRDSAIHRSTAAAAVAAAAAAAAQPKSKSKSVIK